MIPTIVSPATAIATALVPPVEATPPEAQGGGGPTATPNPALADLPRLAHEGLVGLTAPAPTATPTASPTPTPFGNQPAHIDESVIQGKPWALR